MSFEVVVALLRNWACVVKSIASSNHSILQPFSYYPSISLIDVIIICTQLVAVVYNFFRGLWLFYGGLKRRLRARSWAKAVSSLPEPPIEEKKNSKSTAESVKERKVVDENVKTIMSFFNVMQRRVTTQTRDMLMGFSLLIIAEGYTAFALSGLKFMTYERLIWSVASTELALFYLIWVMFDNVRQTRRLSRQALVAARLHKSNTPMDSEVSELVAPICSQNIWETPKLPNSSPTYNDVLSAAKELHAWQRTITRKSARAAAREAELRARLEFIYLILNVIAFFGYGTLIFAHIYPEQGPAPTFMPLGWPTWYPGHTTATWWGVFMGDLAWSIEPMILLAQPRLIKSIHRPANAKNE